MQTCRNINVADFYSGTRTAGFNENEELYKVLNSHLFGTLKLCDGTHHLNVINNFLYSGEIIVEKEHSRAIRIALDYVFGCVKKNIDYGSVIQVAIHKKDREYTMYKSDASQ